MAKTITSQFDSWRAFLRLTQFPSFPQAEAALASASASSTATRPVGCCVSNMRSTSFVALEISGDFYFQQRARLRYKFPWLELPAFPKCSFLWLPSVKNGRMQAKKPANLQLGALQINLSARPHTRVFTLFARAYLWPNLEKALTEGIDCDLGKWDEDKTNK